MPEKTIVRNLSGEPIELQFTDILGAVQSTMIYGGCIDLPLGSVVLNPSNNLHIELEKPDGSITVTHSLYETTVDPLTAPTIEVNLGEAAVSEPKSLETNVSDTLIKSNKGK